MALLVQDGVRIYEPDLDNLVLALRGMFVPLGGLVEAQASPNMSVRVQGSTELFTGVARVTSGAVASLVISAADPANPRIDLVTIDTAGVIAAVTGTPSATPKPPALPSNRALLAYVSVAAAAANITTSNITDRRQQRSFKQTRGTLANRPAAADAGDGTTYFATDSAGGTIFTSTGAAWLAMGAGASVTSGMTNPMTTIGDIIVGGASGAPGRLAIGGSDGMVVGRVAGAVAWMTVASSTLMAEQAMTSGTTKDFAIPAGVKRITIMLVAVSTNGASQVMVQLGDAGGIEAAGYVGVVGAAGFGGTGFNDGFAGGAGQIRYSVYTLTLQDNSDNTWMCTMSVGETSGGQFSTGVGSKALSQSLTSVRITTVNGTDTFDAGVASVMYE